MGERACSVLAVRATDATKASATRAEGGGGRVLRCGGGQAGNKADMLEARQVSVQEAQTYAQDNGLLFVETSAKTAENVNDILL